MVLSASRVTPWARRVLWHATATINSSGASGDEFGPTRRDERSTASILGTAATPRSTALSRDDGSWMELTDRRRPSWWCVLVRTRTRLVSEYPRGDRSYFVDEEVSNFEIDGERLASSRRRRTHGTLSVHAIVVRRTRRTPRLMTSLGNIVPFVEEEGYPYLVRLLVVSRGSPIAPLALARCCWRSRANLDNFLGFRYRKPLSREALPDFGLVTS